MSKRPRPEWARRPSDGEVQPPEPASRAPRADLDRRVWTAGLLRVPGALRRAGNAAVTHWLGRPGPGHPLDPATRRAMEGTFGAGFQAVRVHDGAQARAAAASVDAIAVTHEADIHLGADAPPLPSAEGQRLLAHELAHVVQQSRAGAHRTGVVSGTRDAFEVDADRAATAATAGRPAQVATTGAPPAVQRQARDGDAGGLLRPGALTQSQGELVVESFLNRMWAAQSKQEQPFRITPGVLQGLNLVFLFGAPLGVVTIYSSPREVMDRLRPHIPATVNEHVLKVLDHLVEQEKSLSRRHASTAGAAAPPAETGPGLFPGVPDPRKPREMPDPLGPPAKDASEEAAMGKALQAAYETLRRTQLGHEIEQSVKSYALSKEGIPLDLVVAGGIVTFVAKNDPQLPAVPAIPLGEGITIKIDYKGRASDLPPLLRSMVKTEPDPTPEPGKKETKIGLSVSFTFEAIAELAAAVGRFFGIAATWIAAGVIKVGTAIGKAVRPVTSELLAFLAGAGLGGLIGGLVGGSLGAAIGALIGGSAAVLGSLIRRLVERRKRK